ncbi:hypothetical protein H2198_006891 [Neophaeococcomyces mojaviensis]|uniref:Uncharacterized protein n=1 Tax=Neophaeococcomyces mojaviensis TaxID=3383035 RepID=A0ACC3A1W6_9EURO|nr:hypothetical protein H2198_006891 [Knufia sp. JES_112]
MHRLRKKHSGEYQASTIALVIEKHDLIANIGLIVAENAADNGTTVKHLFARLQPTLTDTTGKQERCLAHIVNIAAKAYLYAKVGWKFEGEEEDETESHPDQLKPAEDAW